MNGSTSKQFKAETVALLHSSSKSASSAGPCGEIGAVLTSSPAAAAG